MAPVAVAGVAVLLAEAVNDCPVKAVNACWAEARLPDLIAAIMVLKSCCVVCHGDTVVLDPIALTLMFIEVPPHRLTLTGPVFLR